MSTVDKAEEAVRKINRAASEEGVRPIVFGTLVVDELRDMVMRKRRIVPRFLRGVRRTAGARAERALHASRGPRTA